jgi:hypothetical protein
MNQQMHLTKYNSWKDQNLAVYDTRVLAAYTDRHDTLQTLHLDGISSRHSDRDWRLYAYYVLRTEYKWL